MLREGLQGQDAARPVRVHTSLIPSSDSLPTDARFDASVGAPTRSVARDTVLDPPRPSPRRERTASEAPGAFGPHPDDNEGAPALQALADSFASLLTYGKADKKGLGSLTGVFVPDMLSIIGLVLFLRLGWSVGEAGVLGALSMIGVGTLMSLLTAFSLCALVSNGKIRGGGAYYLISRSLGAELGGEIRARSHCRSRNSGTE